jgi:ATP-binding cassette subfamily G (WHITE) protein 2 (PDR)
MRSNKSSHNSSSEPAADALVVDLTTVRRQRALYEIRERPAKTYSWQAWLLANIIIEWPFQIIGAFLLFITFYYPVGYYHNAEVTGNVAERGALFFLLCVAFLLFASTFAHFLISGMETAENAGNLGELDRAVLTDLISGIGNLIFSLALIGNGVLVPPSQLGWYKFVYWLSPFTYVTSGFLSTGLSGNRVVCVANELLTIQPPAGQTCGAYMADYFAVSTGYLVNESATADCQICSISYTDDFLASVGVYYSDAWRNLGLIFFFVVFNTFAAVGIYWWARVPKEQKEKKVKKD